KERVKAPAEAIKEAEVVVIATPWSAAEAAIKSLGSLAGKIVIDCMNPLGMGPDGLQLVLGFNCALRERNRSASNTARRINGPQARRRAGNCAWQVCARATAYSKGIGMLSHLLTWIVP